MSALYIAFVAALTAQVPSESRLELDTGALRHTITTANPVAQQYFDQGLRFVYASKHVEAVRSFRTARRIDPACAMCYWGEALALGPNVNGPMSAANDSAAQAAISKAVLHARKVSSHERAYIRALVRRHGPDAKATRGQRDTAYAKAMGEIVRAFPEDADAAVLYAEAQLLLIPGNLQHHGAATTSPYLQTAIGSLEPVLERTPEHPGACRLLIHVSGDATYGATVPAGSRQSCRPEGE